MPRLRPNKGSGSGDAGDAEGKAGGMFERKVQERVQPVVAALDRFKPALEENTKEIRELTRALRERR